MPSKLPKHLSILSKAQLESLCVNCSACCHAQVTIGKSTTVMIPELRCKHLRQDPEGASWCSVYDTRHEVAKAWCFPLEDAIEKGLFPEQCPYVSDMENYRGTKILPEHMYQRMRSAIRKSLIEGDKPAWASDQMWADFVFDD